MSNITRSAGAGDQSGTLQQSSVRRALSGPELDAHLSVSRQYRHRLVGKGVLPQPFYVVVGGRPRWWQDEVDAALACVREKNEAEAAERGRKTRESAARARKARTDKRAAAAELAS
jgi:predicted DNA-binding transcriptional regulator AlpA